MARENLTSKDGISAGSVSFTGNGDAVDGYLALPSDGRPHPGIVVVQEWWGIEQWIKDVAERLAREGYVALAPDLYHGQVVAEPDDAMKAAMALNKDQAVAEIRHAIDYLQGRDDVQPKKLGMTGFCMGGTLTWRTAELENGELAAIAPFYGGGYAPHAEDIRPITAPVLAVWGDQDGGISAAQRDHIVQLLQQEGKTHRARVYPAGHAFMNSRHASYHQASAGDAWTELLAWFQQYLRSS